MLVKTAANAIIFHHEFASWFSNANCLTACVSEDAIKKSRFRWPRKNDREFLGQVSGKAWWMEQSMRNPTKEEFWGLHFLKIKSWMSPCNFCLLFLVNSLKFDRNWCNAGHRYRRWFLSSRIPFSLQVVEIKILLTHPSS